MVSSKVELRKSIKKIISNISPENLKVRSEFLSSNLVKLFDSIQLKDDFILGCFAPMDDEVKWHLKLDGLGDKMAFPGMENDSKIMVFYQSRIENLEGRNDFGVHIMMPPKGALKVVPDILLVPGLAFSRDGGRLGRGKGYYDFYLDKFVGIKVGICLDEQLLGEVPIEGHDCQMDYVVTDRETLKF